MIEWIKRLFAGGEIPDHEPKRLWCGCVFWRYHGLSHDRRVIVRNGATVAIEDLCMVNMIKRTRPILEAEGEREWPRA